MNYIFDLYGTLVDIRTNESKPVLWKSMAQLFGMMGASYTTTELKKAYREEWSKEKKRLLPVMRERYDDPTLEESDVEIQVEEVFRNLLRSKGVEPSTDTMETICMTFRSVSMGYIQLFEGVEALLDRIHESGSQAYLLSNAQRGYTEPEVRLLGIKDKFDGILYSSDMGVSKPNRHFYETLLKTYGLDKEDSVMIGNEYRADILGSHAVGLSSMYIQTAQSGKERGVLPKNCRELTKIGDVLK